MKISNYMTKNVVSICRDEDLIHASKEMKENNIGFLPVVEDNKLKGVITDRDIVLAIANNKELETKVSSIMKTNIFCLNESDDIFDSLLLMKNSKVRRVPIINKKKELVGVISLGDLSRIKDVKEYIDESLSNITEDFTRKYIPPQLDLQVDDYVL